MQASEPRDPYGAALGAVKRFAEAGRFVPGEPIVVTELAAEVAEEAEEEAVPARAPPRRPLETRASPRKRTERIRDRLLPQARHGLQI